MTLNCNGHLVDLLTPRIMGIMNRTPDSFYDGGQLRDDRAILTRAETFLKEGATFLDIGGYSTRPGALDITIEEELKRVVATVTIIKDNFPEALISVDTFRSRVATESVQAGASMINDVSGGNLDEKMYATIGTLQVPYVLMHMRGTPQTMNTLTQYGNVTEEVVFELSQKIAKARTYGINDIIADPGFGFAKTLPQNFEMLAHLEHFLHLEIPILIGISRKSMVYRTLELRPEEALNGTTALHAIALLKGAHILRVHDVKEAMQCVALLENFKN